ncbi:MAG: hypothetical protein ACM3SY_12700 [Candidatus Omnitrophota bacterium]
MASIDEFQGGSLCEIIPCGDKVIKRYSGPLIQGIDSLKRECEWLQALPLTLTEKYPLLVPKVSNFIDNPGLTELHITRINRISISKAIILERVTSRKVTEHLDTLLLFLKDYIYPTRSEIWDSIRIYEQYHYNRIINSREYLKKIPELSGIIDANQVCVNGIECPSVNQFLKWLENIKSTIFWGRKLVAIHGNFHFDNVLFDLNCPPSFDNLTLIDPRGDLIGPSHYDFSKLLLSLEAYYDEINYNMFEISVKNHMKEIEISINIDKRHSKTYKDCLPILYKYLDKFADIEGVSKEDFLLSVGVVECIHLLSLCFYHAYRKNTFISRTQAYLAIFSLIAKRLINLWEFRQGFIYPTERLKTGGLNNGN